MALFTFETVACIAMWVYTGSEARLGPKCTILIVPECLLSPPDRPDPETSPKNCKRSQKLFLYTTCKNKHLLPET